ncbi:hypothetical protein P886_0506 [Alteromonadaceae bacterium 2753L.S.0a.02]|nr:hypothetical protein P886_0506 [Alteromonadaceae bacterium 2753L.S.0a.02]
MSDQDDYQNRRDAIASIAPADIKPHNIPIDVYLQEAENLFHWAKQDFKRLNQAGLSRELLDELPIRVGVLRVAEAHWRAAIGSQRSAERQWSQRSKAAYKLRNELLRSLRYALRHQANAWRPLVSIAGGSGHADMIQDLASLAAMARKHKDALHRVGVSLDIAQQAIDMADQMSALLAQASNEKRTAHPVKVLRDQAYTYLKTVVDEVRECGKFVFHHQAQRLRGYASPHRRSINSASRQKAQQRRKASQSKTKPQTASRDSRIN